MNLRGAVAAFGVFGAFVCITHIAACKDDGTHVYVGQFYVEARGCLGTSSSLDVVSGEESGTCNAVCLIQRLSGGARSVFVSTGCPPYPAAVEFDVSGTDPVCALALAALARKDTCATDGGSSNPVSSAADAAPEGSADASTD